MRQLRNEDDLAGVCDPAIQSLVRLRFAQLAEYDDYTLDELGTFWLVEPGDDFAMIEAISGCPIGIDLFHDVPYGHPDFSPSFEVLETHATCWELAWVFNDGGYGAALFIPKQLEIDAQVQRFCREFAGESMLAVDPLISLP